MATFLWGKVYFKDTFAGYLREEPGDRVSFTYDESYLSGGHSPIAYTLPLRVAPHISENGLHPFFDNLVSEGWLEQAQNRIMGKRGAKRLALLLTFGLDCHGAVSVVDPEPPESNKSMLNLDDPREVAAMASRASLSGVQPKLAVIQDRGIFRPTLANELSTHIAKFPSAGHPGLIENEYITSCALRALLPDDAGVELEINSVAGVDGPALIVKRFDRHNQERLHFEEFNQLLGHTSRGKYDGAYMDMADFIVNLKNGILTQTYLLYRRIIAGLLLGNTDMHFKNFAMLSTPQGYKLAPSYDQVSAILYGYKTVALTIAGARNMSLTKLKPSSIIRLGEEFGLQPTAITMAISGLEKNLEAAKQAISDGEVGAPALKDNIMDVMEKRWNGLFALTGKALSRKR